MKIANSFLLLIIFLLILALKLDVDVNKIDTLAIRDKIERIDGRLKGVEHRLKVHKVKQHLYDLDGMDQVHPRYNIISTFCTELIYEVDDLNKGYIFMSK